MATETLTQYLRSNTRLRSTLTYLFDLFSPLLRIQRCLSINKMPRLNNILNEYDLILHVENILSALNICEYFSWVILKHLLVCVLLSLSFLRFIIR